MESILLTIAIVLLVLDLDERRSSANYRDQASSALDIATSEESRIRVLTDRAVLNMMNEIRRHEQGKPS